MITAVISTDLYLSLGSAAVALCALMVSIGQLRIQRRHNRLSVRPYLDLTRSLAQPAPYCWSLINNGNGIAIITDLRISIDGNPIIFPDVGVLRHALGLIGMTDIMTIATLGKGTYVRAGETLKLLEIPKATSSQVASGKLSWSIKYESIYKERFEVVFSGREK